MKKTNVIFMSFLLCLTGMTFIGCAPKCNNEISEMAMACFKNHQGMTIIFEPQPESKDAQHLDIKEVEEVPKKK